MAEGHTLLEANLEKITKEEEDCKLAGCCSISVQATMEKLSAKSCMVLLSKRCC